MPHARPTIAVVGSLNIDLIASVESLPTIGETVPAMGLIRRFGGKGANQAVAAARQGAKVNMIGCVGSDPEGREYRKRLNNEGIVTAAISTEKAPTGTALIAVDRAGENLIIVVPGANGELTPTMLRGHARRITSAAVLLLQFEVPMPSVIEAVRIANRAGVKVVLNPSPLRSDFPWKECKLDTLIVNEVEANNIFGKSAMNSTRSGQWLERYPIEQVIITRGANSTLCLSRTAHLEVPTLTVEPVDTVGAGDAFAGAYAAQRSAGAEVSAAIRYANCAAALATLKSGAQEAIPFRVSVMNALSRAGEHSKPRR